MFSKGSIRENNAIIDFNFSTYLENSDLTMKKNKIDAVIADTKYSQSTLM